MYMKKYTGFQVVPAGNQVTVGPGDNTLEIKAVRKLPPPHTSEADGPG